MIGLERRGKMNLRGQAGQKDGENMFVIRLI
jgi:hypothetical protein